MFELPTLAPVTPSVGFSPAGFAPAARISARLAPDAVGSKNEPNAPSQSDRMPTLIVPPPEGVASLLADLSPLSPLSSEPHPATSPNASVAQPSAINLLPLTTPTPLSLRIT